MTPEPELAIFVVRASREGGGLRGIVERVKTGEKVPFQDAEAIGRIIARIVDAEAATPDRRSP
jgi:hypothetical protein